MFIWNLVSFEAPGPSDSQATSAYSALILIRDPIHKWMNTDKAARSARTTKRLSGNEVSRSLEWGQSIRCK